MRSPARACCKTGMLQWLPALEDLTRRRQASAQPTGATSPDSSPDSRTYTWATWWSAMTNASLCPRGSSSLPPQFLADLPAGRLLAARGWARRRPCTGETRPYSLTTMTSKSTALESAANQSDLRRSSSSLTPSPAWHREDHRDRNAAGHSPGVAGRPVAGPDWKLIGGRSGPHSAIHRVEVDDLLVGPQKLNNVETVPVMPIGVRPAAWRAWSRYPGSCGHRRDTSACGVMVMSVEACIAYHQKQLAVVNPGLSSLPGRLPDLLGLDEVIGLLPEPDLRLVPSVVPPVARRSRVGPGGSRQSACSIEHCRSPPEAPGPVFRSRPLGSHASAFSRGMRSSSIEAGQVRRH